jgi:hypothetical protein
MTKQGPRTEAGKAVVRLNAVRHGVLSTTPVIPDLERQEDWEAHLAGVMASLAPEGQLETALAERVALTLWRLMRVTRYETEMIAVGQELAENDSAESRSFHLPGPKPIQTARDDLRLAQERLRLLERLPDLPEDASVKGDAAAEVFSSLEDCAYTDIDMEGLAIPGVPDDVDWEDFDGWTGRLVRQAVRVIADRAGSDPENLLRIATALARSKVTRAEAQLQQAAANLDRMRRERLLPVDPVLLKVIRYESHLNRQLYQALHELEALQGRRRGERTPLARLDVQALPEE